MSDRAFFSPTARVKLGDRRARLMGRHAELAALEEAYATVQSGAESRAITIVGAAGIGKSRFVQEFLLKLRVSDAGPPRVYRGGAKDQGAAYEPFARALRARFGIVEGMDAEAAKAQVRAQVSQVLEDRKVGDVVYFLGQLLDLEFADSPLIKAVEGDATQLKFLRRAVIKRFLEADAKMGGGAGRPPVVLVFDDLHWAHDESLDLIAHLIETVQAPILFVCLSRPELIARRDDWMRHGGERHRLMEVGPLPEIDAAAVMNDLLGPCGDEEAVADLVDAACTLAGGNPALLEQMVRIYLDTGVLEVEEPSETDFAAEERWTIHPERLSAVRLPLTVEDAVQARIASLALEEKELLERAAAMGGVFWLGALVAMERLARPSPDVWEAGQERDVDRVRALLRDLEDRDYVLRLPDSSFAGDEEYVFKHNLEREALVKLTAPATARRYHQTIAEYLAFRDNVKTNEEYLAMLARHREKAGSRAQAAVAYVQAADVARSQYANAAAAEYYAKGLELLGDGIESDVDVRLRALHHHGDVLELLGRTDAALDRFRDMLTLSFRLGLYAKGGLAHSRIGRLHRERGNLEESEKHLYAALALFREAGEERGVASALDDMGKLQWLRGDYPRAIQATRDALDLRRKLGDRRAIALSLNNLGLVYQDVGKLEQALDAFEQALDIRRDLGDLVGVSISLNNLGTVAQDQRDDNTALTLFLEAHEVAKETGDRNRMALILTNIGETYSRLGDVKTAIVYLKQAEEICDELGDKVGLAEALRGLGKAYLAQNELGRARDAIQRAVELFSAAESRVQMGVALRSLAEVTAAAAKSRTDAQAARAHLQKAIKLFEEMGNEVELARSFRSYAEVLKLTPELATDAQAQAEAVTYAKRAKDIMAKLRIAAI